MSSRKAQRARENRAYVRMLLRQRQPAFAAALSSAEQYVSCPADPFSCPAGPGRDKETSGRTAGWGEQAERAGVRDRLAAAVRAELGEEVAYMRPDRVHRNGQLAGDLRRGQVGRQVTQHPDLGLAQRIHQAEGVCWPGRTLRRPWLWFCGWPFGWFCGEQVTDLGRQGALVTPIRGIAIEQLPGG